MFPPAAGATVWILHPFDHLLARWIDAEARGDATALATLLDAEFRGDDPLGAVLTKDEWLERCRAGRLAYGAFTWEDVRTEVHDGIAVAMGVQVHRARHQGRDWSGRFPATLVAVRRDDRWAIVNLQLSGTVNGHERA